MSPGPYLALTLLLIVAAASVTQASAWRLGAIAVVLVAITAPGLRRAGRILAKLAAAGVFIAILALSVLWQPPHSPTDTLSISLGSLQLCLSRAAVAFAGLIAAKAAVAVVALSGASALLGERGLVVGLQSLRLPPFVIATFFLTLRYIHVSAAAASAARLAAMARGEPRSLTARATVAGRIIGALVLRGIERAERIGWAMVSRGFSGALPSLVRSPAPAAQWLLALALGGAAVVWALT